MKYKINVKYVRCRAELSLPLILTMALKRIIKVCRENVIAFCFGKINSISIPISIRPPQNNWRWKLTSIRGNIFKHKQECYIITNHWRMVGAKQKIIFIFLFLKNHGFSSFSFEKPNGGKVLYTEMANGKRLCHHR